MKDAQVHVYCVHTMAGSSIHPRNAPDSSWPMDLLAGRPSSCRLSFHSPRPSAPSSFVVVHCTGIAVCIREQSGGDSDGVIGPPSGRGAAIQLTIGHCCRKTLGPPPPPLPSSLLGRGVLCLMVGRLRFSQPCLNKQHSRSGQITQPSTQYCLVPLAFSSYATGRTLAGIY
jgi:hypothetical protein